MGIQDLLKHFFNLWLSYFILNLTNKVFIIGIDDNDDIPDGAVAASQLSNEFSQVFDAALNLENILNIGINFQMQTSLFNLLDCGGTETN